MSRKKNIILKHIKLCVWLGKETWLFGIAYYHTTLTISAVYTVCRAKIFDFSKVTWEIQWEWEIRQCDSHRWYNRAQCVELYIPQCNTRLKLPHHSLWWMRQHIFAYLSWYSIELAKILIYFRTVFNSIVVKHETTFIIIIITSYCKILCVWVKTLLFVLLFILIFNCFILFSLQLYTLSSN